MSSICSKICAGFNTAQTKMGNGYNSYVTWVAGNNPKFLKVEQLRFKNNESKAADNNSAYMKAAKAVATLVASIVLFPIAVVVATAKGTIAGLKWVKDACLGTKKPVDLDDAGVQKKAIDFANDINQPALGDAFTKTQAAYQAAVAQFNDATKALGEAKTNRQTAYDAIQKATPDFNDVSVEKAAAKARTGGEEKIAVAVESAWKELTTEKVKADNKAGIETAEKALSAAYLKAIAVAPKPVAAPAAPAAAPAQPSEEDVRKAAIEVANRIGRPDLADAIVGIEATLEAAVKAAAAKADDKDLHAAVAKAKAALAAAVAKAKEAKGEVLETDAQAAWLVDQAKAAKTVPQVELDAFTGAQGKLTKAEKALGKKDDQAHREAVTTAKAEVAAAYAALFTAVHKEVAA